MQRGCEAPSILSAIFLACADRRSPNAYSSTGARDTDEPVQIDAGLLAAFDEAPVDKDEYGWVRRGPIR